MSVANAGTPLLEQYEGVKSRFPGHLILFRVGDFYETFGEDARLLSRELDVVLTARAPDTSGHRTPMAGVPHHAIDTYLGRLVRRGYKVALCDQVEEASAAKGLLRREVTRIVSPGTVVEERILPGPDHNFLAAVSAEPGGVGAYAAVDVSTGELYSGTSTGAGRLGVLLALGPFAPREILIPPVPEGSSADPLRESLRQEFPGARIEVTPAPIELDRLPERVRTATAALGVGEQQAIRCALAYVGTLQPRLLPYVRIESQARSRHLRLDAKSLRHLEITRPMSSEEAGTPTLLSTWNEAITAPGRRLLGFWLRTPLAEVTEIRFRQELVAALMGLAEGLVSLRELLGKFSDISRIASRIATRQVRPPEIAALVASLEVAAALRAPLAGIAPLRTLADRLDPPPDLAERIHRSIAQPPPASSSDPGVFRSGVFSDLDSLRKEEVEGIEALRRLELSERDRTGIRGLRVRYHQVLGYYFDVSRANLARVPPEYRRTQSVSSGERFTSDALTEIGERVLLAQAKGRETEAGCWERFLSDLEAHIPELHLLARAVGELDALATFAHLAILHRLVRPEIDDGPTILIRDGRHPVLERTLGERFVPNDTELSLEDHRLLVLTGPNMSGKSTYMRQVGLLVLLAHAGAFLPVKHARIGVVSSLHTRMGFADEIGRGKSSFLVEMSEIAEILRTADERSLVLLDEVGRGTSTFDGLALAWATLRYLHDVRRCRTILATHYHQLTTLTEALSGAQNAHFAVREERGDVSFLHRLVPGSTDRSLGLHVARLAGLPPEAIQEADRLLQRLERAELPLSKEAPGRRATRYTQGVLLGGIPEPSPSAVERELAALDPERMTPLEALAWLHERAGKSRKEPLSGRST